MKILLTGGGSGGHFYPIIAVAQSLNTIAKEHKIADLKLFYMAPEPYDEKLLSDNGITFIPSTAGKIRRYFSLMNFIDLFKTGWGIVKAIWTLFRLYPDVVFGKGGYVSFPAVFAAWVLRIPIVIHESDSVPGKANAWAGKFAQRVAVSYPDAAAFFKQEKVAFTGNPVRHEILNPVRDGADEFLHLDSHAPVILILGGSQGSQIINQTIIDALPRLVEKYQIIHQTGVNNLEFVTSNAHAVLLTSEHKDRFKPMATLDSLTLRMAAGAADLIISRAGSTIFEIAVWNVPAILIPITSSNGDHQRKNAYSYARTGAAIVVEEANLTPNLLRAAIDRLMDNEPERQKMKRAAQNFARVDSADLIAQEILGMALEHEK